MATPKKLHASWTVWFNLLVLGLALPEVQALIPVPYQKYALAFAGLGNLALRLRTSSPLEVVQWIVGRLPRNNTRGAPTPGWDASEDEAALFREQEEAAGEGLLR